MKLAHYVKVKVFVKEEDDEQEIKQALFSLVPIDLKKEKIMLKEQSATGFFQKKIKILEIDIEKSRHINTFVKNLQKNLSPNQKDILLKQLYSRLDKNNHFFIRLDKPELIEKKEYTLTDKGNCFHITLSIAAFPATAEKAAEAVKKIFQ